MASFTPPIKFHRIKSQDSKPLPIFTSVYYKLSVKSIPNGIVTYELEPRQEGHLIQLALNYLEDFDPEGDLRPNCLWTLLPEVANPTPTYHLKVMSHPEGNLTYTHGSSWGGRYMELDLKNPEHYNPGSTMHSSSLWHINLSELPDYFTLHNSDERRNPNFVTFSNEPSDLGQLMQIGTKDLENYEAKGPFRQDALWSFKPANYQLFAFVTNFEFQIPSDAEISEEAYPIGLIDEVILNKENNKINFSQEIPETFALCFLQSFKIFSEECVSIDSKSFPKLIPFLSKNLKELEFEKKLNTQWTCTVGTEYKIQQELQIPEGTESVKVKGYCSVVKELEIPFTAVVEIGAKADVADCENGGIKREMVEICDSEVIESFLKVERFAGKIISKGKKTVDKDLENVVRCQVSGRLKCTCGLDTYVNVK